VKVQLVVIDDQDVDLTSGLHICLREKTVCVDLAALPSVTACVWQRGIATIRTTCWHESKAQSALDPRFPRTKLPLRV
ncbi:hypothetical protein JOB18_020373, partial [Solea senegalensis]